MLFIISSNNKTPEDVSLDTVATGSIEAMEESEEADLDNLVKMISDDEQESKIDEWEESENEENNEMDESKEKGFFAKLFSRKQHEDSEDESEEVMSDIEESIDEIIEDKEESHESEGSKEEDDEKEGGIFSKLFKKSNDEDDVTVVSEDMWNTTSNLVKDVNSEKIVSTEVITTYAPEVLGYEYPGVDLETEIGKKFEVGVYSLKLNNAYFNETLGYMLKWDTVTQLTDENVYGCFMVEVSTAANPENLGKKWYVCKKYLQDVTQADDTVTQVESDTVVSSNVGDVITIEKTLIEFGDGIQLQAGDKIDQLSPADENGCFMAHVYESQIVPNVVPVGNICMSDIK